MFDLGANRAAGADEEEGRAKERADSVYDQVHGVHRQGSFREKMNTETSLRVGSFLPHAGEEVMCSLGSHVLRAAACHLPPC